MSQRGLKATSVLHRVTGLEIYINASNEIQVIREGQAIACGTHGLAVLDLFAAPLSLAAALQAAKVRGLLNWIDFTSTVTHLYKAGILVDHSQERPLLNLNRPGYAATHTHVLMLNDRVRTDCFIHGIQETIRPGDVVVEVGTGTGILAMAAAKAGAARVYAIEASDIATIAEDIIRQNGLDHCITVIRGYSTQIELPEQADVFISEMVGDDPLEEKILEITMDAAQRFLKPEARFVPSQCRIWALPVTIAQEELEKRTLTPTTLEHWQAWYGVDLMPLKQIECSLSPSFFIKPQRAVEWTCVGAPTLLAALDFSADQPLLIDVQKLLTVTEQGILNGLLIYFELQLGSISFSTHPAQADVNNHWSSPVWYVGERRTQPGDRFAVRYQYGVSGTGSQLQLSKL